MKDNDSSVVPSNVASPNHQHRHFKMYKPAQVLTQFKFTHRKRRNRTLLGDVIATNSLPPSGVMAIGRLDEDSEGLLLLTTDGKVSEQVRRKSVEKEYYVQVEGVMTEEAIERLQNGVKITLPAKNKSDDDDDDNNEERSVACDSAISPSSSKFDYTTMACQARILDTSIITVENKKPATNKQELDTSSQPGQEVKAPPRQKRRKFSGTCNLCKQIGHKAKDCRQNPINNISNGSYHCNSVGGAGAANDNSSNNNKHDVQLALPTGIPPPTPGRDGHYNIRYTTSSRPTSWISITINEGKNRQVRRMTAAVGFPTLRLVRVRIGCVTLDGMIAGEVRELTADTIDRLIT